MSFSGSGEGATSISTTDGGGCGSSYGICQQVSISTNQTTKICFPSLPLLQCLHLLSPEENEEEEASLAIFSDIKCKGNRRFG
jgi:hypothetical protein